jgi:hypothetical protein
VFFESYAIIAVVLLMSYILSRQEKSSGYAVAILPLLIVPAVHIAGRTIVRPITQIFSIDSITAWVIIELIALMLTCLLLGAISVSMKNRNLRVSYLALCGGFSVILTSIYLVKSVLIF